MARFDKIAKETIEPIMQKIFDVAFNCIVFKGDYDEPVFVPTGVKEGLLEELKQIIEYCKEQESTYDSASIIGFALGKDGFAPGRKYRSIAEMVTALHDLIEAKDQQIKNDLSGAIEHKERERMAARLGF